MSRSRRVFFCKWHRGRTLRVGGCIAPWFEIRCCTSRRPIGCLFHLPRTSSPDAGTGAPANCSHNHLIKMKQSTRGESPLSATLRSASSIVHKSGSVWMMAGKSCQSCAREIAEIAIRSIGLDETDHRIRDRVITAISPKIETIMDAARDLRGQSKSPRRVECCGAFWDSKSLKKCPTCKRKLGSKQNTKPMEG
jgi:predicted Zn-ribbon and HTH transcriptional regulator